METFVKIVRELKDEHLVIALLLFFEPKPKLNQILVSKYVFLYLGQFVDNRRFQMLSTLAAGKLPLVPVDEYEQLKQFYLRNHFCPSLDHVLSLSNTTSSELVHLAIRDRRLCCLKTMITRQRGCKKYKILDQVALAACRQGDLDLYAVYLNNGGKIQPNHYVHAVEGNHHLLLETLLALIPYSGKVCLWDLLDKSRPQNCLQIFNSDLINKFNDAYNPTEQVLNEHEVSCTCRSKPKMALY